MEVTLEKVDEVIRRKNVSYSAAKAALEQNNGDVLEALASLDGKKTSSSTGLWTSIKQLLRRLSKIRVMFEKEASQLLDLPLPVVILAGVFFFPLVVAAVIVLLLLGYSIRLRKGSQDLFKVPALDVFPDDVE